MAGKDRSATATASLSAYGSRGIANIEINRGGVKNHVGRHVIARAKKGQTRHSKARVSG